MAMLIVVPSGPALLVLLVAGLTGGYCLLRWEMGREIGKLRSMIEGMAIQPDAAEAAPKPAPVSTSPLAAAPTKPVKPPSAPEPPVARNEGITPEILAIIGAAVAQFVGAGARIRSTRLLAPMEGMNAWAQQGRVIIQASHNLGMR